MQRQPFHCFARLPVWPPRVKPRSRASAQQRKIKFGLVGCGARGGWLSEFFQQHGGYQFHAVADYFQDRAEGRGRIAGVDKRRCFSGLSGYQKVIESGIEAIVLQTPPCFFPEHARAAVEAGLHIYVAKPVAVDVPGCLTIEAAGKLATEKKRVFLVDYQIPTEPANIEVAEHIRKGEMGKPTKVITNTIGGSHNDRPKSATIEDRLAGNVWANDIALGGSTVNYFDIHMINAAIWILGQRPVAAIGEAVDPAPKIATATTPTSTRCFSTTAMARCTPTAVWCCPPVRRAR